MRGICAFMNMSEKDVKILSYVRKLFEVNSVHVGGVCPNMTVFVQLIPLEGNRQTQYRLNPETIRSTISYRHLSQLVLY